MATQPSHPLAVVGAVIIVLALVVLLTEMMLRMFRRRGLVQGAVGRKRGESLRDHQGRNRDFDDREIAAFRRCRPLVLGAAAVGAALVVVGIVL